MGKRLRRGGGGGLSAISPSSVMDRSILLRRMKTLTLTLNSSPDPDLLIQRLRDHYPDYARIKLQLFSARLREVLQQLSNTSTKPPAAGDTSQSSSSDDSALEENMEPEFDVTKSMLRERYVKQSEQSVRKGNEEKNVEIEAVVDEKRKIAIGMKEGGGSGKEIPVVVGSDRGSNELSRGTGREGPMFRDLGGMSNVLEDLMMQVNVSLCHLELPLA